MAIRQRHERALDGRRFGGSGRARAGHTGIVSAAAALAGCAGSQSALDPAGLAAERIADLFWGMTIGGAAIWLAVSGLALYAARAGREAASVRRMTLLIVGGGVAFPAVVLAGLLSYSFAILPGLLAPAPSGSLKIRVIGEQWWWRVHYLREGAEPVELANEIRLPVGEPVELELQSSDVIHSFWIPALGGKMDMIPGRVTRLALHPTRTGVYRAACAEYCGASHALMNFAVVIEEPQAFERWLAGQATNAATPASGAAAVGGELFVANGCGACHAVRGTSADGVIGPDLTHVGGRLTIGAGTLPSTPEAFRTWLAQTADVKPSVHMPAFGMLPPEDLQALAAYLEALQ